MPDRPVSQELLSCASALQHSKKEIVDALSQGHSDETENRFQDSPEVFRLRSEERFELLVKYLSGAGYFGDLYVGQRIFELTRLENSRTENLALYRRAFEQERRTFAAVLTRQGNPDQAAAFETAYEQLTSPLLRESARHVKALFIGDCLLTEILAFTIGPLANVGLSIDPYPVNPRDPAQLRKILSDLSNKTFDVVFFSPFSHSRVPELEALADGSHALASGSTIRTLVDSIVDQTSALLEELKKRFECPIFVHDAAMVTRGSSKAKVLLRQLASARTRTAAAGRINQWLEDHVRTSNASTYQHLFVIRETELVKEHGRLRLGQFLNTSEFQHATVLSQLLAQEYVSRITAVGQLLGKKLVICDLDNTLWDGVIGEGPVRHHEVRQASLKKLKDHCGIVLSIASKNDPTSVHFNGGVLALTDFVAPQISWGPKANAVARIKSGLNLQTKHMVFLDDRPDERALVKEEFPDLLVLDPEDRETWRIMNLWGEITFGSSDEDRTRMYQQQALRDAELGSEPEAKADGNSLKKLGLVISLATAKTSDLKRVAELINRSNQWNLCGTRTTFAQVQEWHKSESADIILAHVADRFGDMGNVGIAIVTFNADHVRIPVFVLSCRVFGYGVETALLSEAVRRAKNKGGNTSLPGPVIGDYKANAQNHPCRNMYRDHGFTLDNDVYKWNGLPAFPDVPWAQIKQLS
jgi:FkbH-like protein